jgi:hypothetical protein
VPTQSWRGKSAVFRIYGALTSNGYRKSIKAVRRQRNLGLPLIMLGICNLRYPMYVIKHGTILTLNPEISIQHFFSIIPSAKIKQLIESILIFNFN